MTNPWIVEEAFDDMFVDSVLLDNISYAACVFPVEDVDPFTESVAENNVKQINILIRCDDIAARPNLGDSVLYNEKIWKVSDVEKEQNWYKISARSKT